MDIFRKLRKLLAITILLLSGICYSQVTSPFSVSGKGFTALTNRYTNIKDTRTAALFPSFFAAYIKDSVSGSLKYSKFRMGFGLTILPLGHHLIPGFNLNIEYNYTRRCGIGFWYSFSEGATARVSGFSYTHPYLTSAEPTIINRFKLIDRPPFQASFFCKTGIAFTTLSDEENNIISDLISIDRQIQKPPVPHSAQNYFLCEPGVTTAWLKTPSKTGPNSDPAKTYLALDLSYRFLSGGSTLGSTRTFSGLRISIGLYLYY